MTVSFYQSTGLRRGFLGLLVLILVLGMAFAGLQTAQALTPPALQYFYITLPEAVMLQYLDEIFNTPTSPVRSITSIAIGTSGTVIYYDQWEDGGYDTDIANPGTNVYNAATNSDGTQIWGDGVLANGCTPFINNLANPCAQPSDDLLVRGNMITLDNNVIVNGTLGSYTRNSAQVFFDGGDKVAASLPVALARAMWPSGVGSLVADAQGILPTERWGTDFISPVGENLDETGSHSYEDVRLLVMAGAGGATINVDANADGDFTDPTDRNGYVMAEGQVLSVNDAAGTVNNASTSVRAGARVQVTAGNPVQVTLLTGDPGSTYENRFYNLIPRGDWVSDYYSPVGTPAGAQCTSNYVFNPNGSAITVSYDFLGGASPNYTQSIPANSAAELTNGVPTGSAVRIYTAGGQVFLPISMTDCVAGTGNGDIYDWGHELYPVDQLSPEILIGWTPGCTNESAAGTCLEVDGTPNNTKSRSVVWVTPLQNTNLYVDLDGSGISCPAGTGAERMIAATALQAVQITDDPDNVRDQFDSAAYNLNGGGNYNANWGSVWDETGDNDNPGSGSILINANQLRFQAATGSEAGDYIERSVNLAGMGFARLSFRSTVTNLDAGDSVAVDVYNGSGWINLDTYDNSDNGGTTTQVFDIHNYASANSRVRFRAVTDLGTGDTWDIDNVNIDYSVGGRIGDFDMTGSYIRTCDDTLIAAAFGQNPALSASGDNEAMDLGMGIPPYGSQIRITKDADRTFASPGELVTYTYTVRLIQTFSTAVNNVEVVDDKCSPAAYSSGDTANAGYLDPGEVWNFTCSGPMYENTTNFAMALALYGSDRIRSNPASDTVLLTSSLGDYVWVDEDGDGDQDAGESGIPNVRVTLTGTDLDGNSLNLTTYTDAAGRYLFADVPPSNSSGYIITVDSATLPAGLAANPTYDENGLGTPNVTTVVLGSNVDYATADFGYNWATTTETNNPSGVSTGAIGDRLWSDADGDGFQDPGEPGLYNITVELLTAGTDGLFGTADDVVAATTTTNYTGNYIFDGLGFGAFAVRIPTAPVGFTLTGDPDQPGVPCTVCDSHTTAPIVLAPGDVYLNADFGFQPDASSGATIGDTIWLDADRDNSPDAGEPGIPGVTVSLIRDLNGNGVWDAGEPVIATNITDANGQFAFSGVPVDDGVGSDDYLVWVDDTANVLAELTPTYDHDGISTPHISAVTDLTPAGNLDQDFAYAPAGHDAIEALVGDTVWFDLNNNGTYDPGEGLEGVVVNLFQDIDSDGIYEFGEPFLGRTITNENGQYFIGGLPAGTYTVDIDLNTLPNYGIGLINFVDPDGGTPHRAVVTLTAGEIQLDQDFGYRAAMGYTIGGTLWNDSDTDGLLEGGESGRYEGVSVTLYTDSNDNGVWDAADELIGTTLTDSSGNYNFTSLPNDLYFVDVTDDANILDGAWHSLGTAGSDNNSQTDYYTITLSGADNTTADFGYYRIPPVIGDFVWSDNNSNGIQDFTEPGMAGVEVTLTITWPGGAGTTTLHTSTDANGYYSFDNLLLDEDLDGAGAGEPIFSVSVTTPTNYSPSPVHAGSDPALDSGDPAGETASPVEGSNDLTVDFGFIPNPASIGDRVWSDLNFDGVQDAGELGVPGATVELYDSGNNLVATTTTDGNGDYLFSNLGVGDYSVHVISPAGWAPTYDEDSGTTSPDQQTSVTVSAGELHDTADFGYQPALAVGGTVWDDTDDNDASAVGDPGIASVTVELWSVDGSGNPLALLNTTTTNANGNYLFNGLGAGEYILIVPSAPPGFSSSVLGNPDPDDNVDSDDNGAPAGGGSVGSLPITLDALDVSYNGQEPDAPEDGDINRSNLTVDFGFATNPNSIVIANFSGQSPHLTWMVALAGLVLLAVGSLVGWKRRQKVQSADL